MEKQAQEIGQFLHERGREGGGPNGRKQEKDAAYVTAVSLFFCFSDTATHESVKSFH